MTSHVNGAKFKTMAAKAGAPPHSMMAVAAAPRRKPTLEAYAAKQAALITARGEVSSLEAELRELGLALVRQDRKAHPGLCTLCGGAASRASRFEGEDKTPMVRRRCKPCARFWDLPAEGESR